MKLLLVVILAGCSAAQYVIGEPRTLRAVSVALQARNSTMARLWEGTSNTNLGTTNWRIYDPM
jgi:hypothetical protein